MKILIKWKFLYNKHSYTIKALIQWKLPTINISNKENSYRIKTLINEKIEHLNILNPIEMIFQVHSVYFIKCFFPTLLQILILHGNFLQIC